MNGGDDTAYELNVGEQGKFCSSCGGPVHVGVIRGRQDDGSVCFALFFVGTCESCGRTFTESELHTLDANVPPSTGVKDRPPE
jgi:hypothetical protein